jgi:uncharacterized phage-associated protein
MSDSLETTVDAISFMEKSTASGVEAWREVPAIKSLFLFNMSSGYEKIREAAQISITKNENENE